MVKEQEILAMKQIAQAYIDAPTSINKNEFFKVLYFAGALDKDTKFDFSIFSGMLFPVSINWFITAEKAHNHPMPTDAMNKRIIELHSERIQELENLVHIQEQYFRTKEKLFGK